MCCAGLVHLMHALETWPPGECNPNEGGAASRHVRLNLELKLGACCRDLACVPVVPSLIFPGIAANTSQMLGPLPSVALAPSICTGLQHCDGTLQHDVEVASSRQVLSSAGFACLCQDVSCSMCAAWNGIALQELCRRQGQCSNYCAHLWSRSCIAQPERGVPLSTAWTESRT